ncbi:hypothetical protein PFICI_15207 [Pestalotiopsis fici W106-1]|uniref:beta-glucosidase n=1 Tax=Pestalotiopsis fici (strain W106-1 / CGMCC3.15140) TaxID=1229662 RepID=W3WIP4_PESFW|nr:uncharacterized protein PFICI_15207 [Pestalotiopsis fici W106-1]ETS73032.1 hypothetical protein PFICI_15207 [Pestalotiopsis fici W106-1]
MADSIGDLDREVKDLVARLTVDEKISLLAGKNTWETMPIERLDIPSLKVSDGPNGARGADFFDGMTAACFPACVSLAATFDRDLSRRIGQALGQEAQTKGAYVVLGPTVCTHRSPLGGRNFEAFSEDPLLSGLMAAEYVKGLQSERVGATVKHFLANEQDTRRFTVNEIISERALREIYLRAFEIVLKKSDPWCFMSSYPKVNGRHVDAQPLFLQTILREEWGYDGLLMSDWGAVSNAVESVKFGLGLEMPGPPSHRIPEAVKKAVLSGLISAEELDRCAATFVKLLKRTGKLDDRRKTPPEKSIDLPEHRHLIREAGADGIVLLKNHQNILPIDPRKFKKLALLGPLANYAAAYGGGSASLNCHYKISPYDAFENRLGDQVELSYSKGAHIFRVYPDLIDGSRNREGNQGFTADFYDNLELGGEPVWTEHYARGFFTSMMNDSLKEKPLSARFATSYTPPVSGKHYLSFSGMGPSKLFINGEMLSHQQKETKDSMTFFLGVHEEHRFQYEFCSEKSYEIVVETVPSQVNNSELSLLQGQISAHLGLVYQEEMEASLYDEAISLAKEADLAICFVGNTVQWETEGQDLQSMCLPANGSQDRLVAGVARANPNTIVVITTGVPVELPWIDDVAALMQGWYAGQETGNSILDVILGDVNPSGKLPVSWPKKYEHTACYGNFGLDSYESRQVEYVEGVNVGYRHFDHHYDTEKEVRFPFGFGLGYTSFDILDVKVAGQLVNCPIDTIVVLVTIRNTGSRIGSQVIQVYLSPPHASKDNSRPRKALVAFEKVKLHPGEEKAVEMGFGRDAAAYWDDRSKDEGGYCWRVEKGVHEIAVGTSSRPSDLAIVLSLEIPEEFSFGP